MKQLLYWLLIAVVMVACQKQLPHQDQLCQLQLQTTIQKQVVAGEPTRLNATWDAFANGDRIGMQLVEWSGFTEEEQVAESMESSGNHTDNHLFELLADHWAGDPLASPVTWRKFAVYAYYPYKSSVGDLLKIEIAPREDQSGGVVSTDFAMRAIGASGVNLRGAEPLQLSFRHLLTHLRVALTMPASYGGKATGEVVSVTVIGAPKSTLLDMSTGVLSPSDAKSAIKMHKDGATFEAVVVPCVVAAGDPILKVDFLYANGDSGYFLTYAPASSLVLKSSQIHTINAIAMDLNCMTEFVFPAAGGMRQAIITTSMEQPWTLSPKDTPWLTVANQNEVTAAANLTEQPRLGRLVLENGVLTREVNVLQN